MRVSIALVAVAVLSILDVDVALACERCFGSGSDAPAVRAVTASMMALFMVICFVFGGVFSFFHSAHVRSQALTADSDDAPNSPTD